MTKRIKILFFILFVGFNINAQMILVFATNVSEGTTITVPLQGTVGVNIDWGDGGTESFTTAGNPPDRR